jgi:hypothetical protein
MEFEIKTNSDDGIGIWGNTARIKELKNTKIKIETIDELKKLSDEVDTDLTVNFKEMTITVIDYYGD